jgi:hypothetical protein
MITSIFILWFLNLELNIGSVWLRPDINGNTIFVPFNFLSFIKACFTMKEMWYPTFWDINIFTFFSFGLSYYYIILGFLQL